MIGISSSGFAIALVLLAIAVLILMALRFGSKPKQRPEKREKAEIMKQVLALSQSVQGVGVRGPSARLRAPVCKTSCADRQCQPQNNHKVHASHSFENQLTVGRCSASIDSSRKPFFKRLPPEERRCGNRKRRSFPQRDHWGPFARSGSAFPTARATATQTA